MSPLTIAILVGALCTALATVGAGVQTIRLQAVEAELVQVRTDAVKAALTYAENARTVEGNWGRRINDAQRAREAERVESGRVDDALRTDADGLRDDILAYAAGSADDSAAACRERATTLGRLLDKALRADRRSTASAEAHAADARGVLAGWPVIPGGKE